MLNNGHIEQMNFYSLDNTPNNKLGETEIIERMDRLFSEAITRQFDKDREYGLKHFVALSGGLDSRMTSWVAHKLGYHKQVNYTFSQSDYLDETIPKQIASDLKHEWIFKSLDNGIFLKNLEEVTKITGGNVMYHGVAHGLSFYNIINFENFGICHSGQLGDVIFGSYVNKIENNKENMAWRWSIFKKNFWQKQVRKQDILKDMQTMNFFCCIKEDLTGLTTDWFGIQRFY